MMYSKPSPRKSALVKIVGLFILLLVISAIVLVRNYTLNSFNSLNKPNKPTSSASGASNNNHSESLAQLNPTNTSAGPIKVVYELPEKQSVVYITIDDGWYPNEEVIKLMQKYHLPITTFLIEQAAQKHPNFWNEFVKSGGHIEDHTFSHPYLTHLSPIDQKNQISQPIDYLRQFGSPPYELRPPYGDFNSEVGQAAHDSGIKYIVMWNAEMENSKFTARNGLGLKAGDIILLHWVPGLDKELIELLNIIQSQNLGIADLTQALNGEPLTICWLKKQIPIPKPKTTTSTGISKINTFGTSNTPGTSSTTTGAFTIP